MSCLFQLSIFFYNLEACLAVVLKRTAFKTWPLGYNFFFMLNSTEHEVSSAHKTIIPTNVEVSCFKSLRCCFYPAHKCKNANNCWYFNIYEQDKFRVESSMKTVL